MDKEKKINGLKEMQIVGLYDSFDPNYDPHGMAQALHVSMALCQFLMNSAENEETMDYLAQSGKLNYSPLQTVVVVLEEYMSKIYQFMTENEIYYRPLKEPEQKEPEQETPKAA